MRLQIQNYFRNYYVKFDDGAIVVTRELLLILRQYYSMFTGAMSTYNVN